MSEEKSYWQMAQQAAQAARDTEKKKADAAEKRRQATLRRQAQRRAKLYGESEYETPYLEQVEENKI